MSTQKFYGKLHLTVFMCVCVYVYMCLCVCVYVSRNNSLMAFQEK